MMNSSASLSGETLFLRQAALLLEHPPPAWKLCSAVQRPTRPCSLNLTYTISVPAPAQQDPFREVVSSLAESEKEDGGDVEEKAQPDQMQACSLSAPNLSGGSSPSDFTVSKEKPFGDRGTPRWVNPFIPEQERRNKVGEDEEEEDDLDGDNLHKYQEDFSFQLHGDTRDGDGDEALPCPAEVVQHHGAENAGTRRTKWSQERGVSKELENLSQQGVEVRPRCNSRSIPMIVDCGDADWGESGDSDGVVLTGKSSQMSANCPCALSKPHKESESLVDNVSDSSSSDGVLVNFSTIYNKSNNAVEAIPFDVESRIDPSHGTSSLPQDGSNPTPCWPPQGIDPNCNYQLDSEGVPSPVASDVTLCLHAQTRLAVSTQNYYKLVTCDLSSQSSPSPAWSSVTSCSEGQGSPTPPAEYFLFRRDGEEGRMEAQPEEEGEEKPVEDITKGSTEDPFRKEIRGKTFLTRSCDTTTTKRLLSPAQQTLPRVPSCPGHLTAHGTRQHVTSFAEIAYCKRGTRDTSSLRTTPEDHQSPSGSQVPQRLSMVTDTEYEGQHVGSASTPSLPNQDNKIPVNMDEESLPSTSTMEGACSSSPGVVRFSKDQRPTSLPIQPFVLQLPPGKQQKPLGSLLNQYLSHGKSGTHRGKGKENGKVVPTFLRPSPLGGYSSFQLEAASSSDTCSTCTPSPVPFPNRSALVLYHHTTSPPDVQCHPDKNQSCSSNPFRPYMFQSSPDEALDCQSKHSEDSTSPPPQTCAKLSPEASNGICSPKCDSSLPTRHTLEPSPKMVDPFQPLSALSSYGDECQAIETTPVWDISHRGPSPAVTSVTSLNTPPCLAFCLAERPQAQCSPSGALSAAAICRPAIPKCFQGKRHQPQSQHQQGDSFSLTDRPPEEFCLSPDASSETLSIDLLQKKALLKAVSSAVDLIVTYFEHPSRDPDEKLQLGNSTLNPTIAQLVLNQLCPAIRNILQDGLRSYKLDLIVGQRRNQPWDIVLASTQPGPTTRVLHSLVSVVSKCSQLTKHSMRFNAFIMGLLNLRALEFWLNHLYTCVDVLRPLYHHWGLVPLLQGPYLPHLHELLLHLEPLAALPFDLHLLSEARLLKRTSSLLAQSAYSSLQMSAISTNQNKGGEPRKEQAGSADSRVRGSSIHTALLSPQTFMQHISSGPQSNNWLSKSRPYIGPLGGSTGSDSAVGWWLKQPAVVEGVMTPSVDTQENRWREEESKRGMERTADAPEERSPQELRWARLFGGRVGAPTKRENKQQGPSRAQKNRLPSQWLSLDGSGLEFLAQSVWPNRRQEPHPYPNQTLHTAEGNQHQPDHNLHYNP